MSVHMSVHTSTHMSVHMSACMSKHLCTLTNLCALIRTNDCTRRTPAYTVRTCSLFGATKFSNNRASISDGDSCSPRPFFSRRGSRSRTPCHGLRRCIPSFAPSAVPPPPLFTCTHLPSPTSCQRPAMQPVGWRGAGRLPHLLCARRDRPSRATAGAPRRVAFDRAGLCARSSQRGAVIGSAPTGLEARAAPWCAHLLASRRRVRPRGRMQ